MLVTRSNSFWRLIVALGLSLTTLAATNRIPLRDDWYLARVPDVQEQPQSISTSGYDLSQWIPAVVPGTVLTSYEKAGLIDDPYYSDNLKKLDTSYYDVAYWYRTEFQTPTIQPGQKLWLNFDGINWKAIIYLNGTELGKIDGAFIQTRFDITDLLAKDSSNALAVKLTLTKNPREDAPAFIGSSGWDWMPPIPGRNTGIYNDVYLTTTGQVLIDDPFIKTILPLPKTDSADVSIEVTLTNTQPNTVRGTLFATIDSLGITFSHATSIKGQSQRTLTFDKTTIPELAVKNPPLWWPNGYGEPNLHQLNLTFKINSDLSDASDVSFGIRQFSYNTKAGHFVLSVNGVPVLCKGGNWGLPDAMLKWLPEQFDTAVRYHKELNFTMIRNYHGTSDFEAFYQACDKYGILVFEDFWLHGIWGPKNKPMFFKNAENKFKRLRNHPAIALWCAKDIEAPAKDVTDELIRLYQQYDNTRFFQPSSGKDVMHATGPFMIQDPAAYFNLANGFTTKIGSPSIPAIQSMQKMMDEEDLWPLGEMWNWHDWDQDLGMKRPDIYINELNMRYGDVVNVEDLCRKAQLMNLETYKAIFESYNDKLWDKTSGVLVWLSQPAWPSTIWQLYDYYFDCGGAYYGAKKACEPIHIQWNQYDHTVKAINLTQSDLHDITVLAQAYNLDGSLRHSHIVSDMTLPKNSATKCFQFLRTVTPNLALNKPGQASSQTNVLLDVLHVEQAFDGHARTRWASEYDDQQWLSVDLGKVYTIDTVTLLWEVAYGKAYDIDVSTDGSNWTTVYSTVTGDGDFDRITFNPIHARFVRMNGKRRGTNYGYSIYEMNVYEAGRAPMPLEGLSDVYFVKLYLKDKNDKTLSENIYWEGLTHMDYKQLSKLKQAELKCLAVQTSSKTDHKVTVTLENSNKTIALAVQLMLINRTTGERILPAIYSDNYITLIPGQSQDVTIDYASRLLGKDAPELIVQGWNYSPVSVTIKTN